jgi:MFS family permease
MEPLTRRVDRSKWTFTQWSLFSTLSLGFFIWGIYAAIGPLSYSSFKTVLTFIVPTLATLIGDLVLPFLSDRSLGRKTAFFVTLGLYGIGALVILLSAFLLPKTLSLVGILSGVFVGTLGVEGEVPVALSYAGENFPLKHREKILVLMPNFNNLGAAIAAFLAYLVGPDLQLKALGVLTAVVVTAAFLLRLAIPESVRWLVVKGRRDQAVKEASRFKGEEAMREEAIAKRLSLKSRYLFLVIISVSQYLTYGLMAFVAPQFYSSSLPGSIASLTIFVANMAATVAGVVLGLTVSRLRTRILAAFSYLGGTFTMVPISALAFGVIPFSVITFYALLSLNMVFSEFAWAVRTITEPLLFPTKVRALMIGLVRAIPISSYAISTLLTSSLTWQEWVIYNLVLWGLGSSAALWWYSKGYDTNAVPIEFTSQEGQHEARLK